MLSDASDDEPQFEKPKHGVMHVPWPPLRLYEEEEFESWDNERDHLRRPVVGGKKREPRDHYRQYQTWRFLDSIVGYHIGDLDLTGRHLPRYERLMSRWNNFLRDFNELSLTVELQEGENGEDDYYLLNNWDVWISFVKRWHVSRSAGYGALADPVRDVLEQLHETPLPKIQKICLLHLPTEILDYVFQTVELEEARTLSSACHQLRDIGKRHIFVSRSFRFDFPFRLYDERRDKNASDNTELAISLVTSHKDTFLDNAKFLMSRPDLSNAVHSLSIENNVKGWTTRFIDGIDRDEVNKRLDREFFLPLSNVFGGVISSCANLRTLIIWHIELTIDILQAISTLPRLNVLEFFCCTIPVDVLSCIYAGGKITPNPSVLNLEMRDGDDSIDPYGLISLYPSLRTFFVGTSEFRGFLQPLHTLPFGAELFKTVEMLCIEGLCAVGVLRLVDWLRLDLSRAPLRLTHLKIICPRGIPDSILFELIDALQTAPLKVLVLDGIKDGSLELIDRLAATFPQLLALTLMRRENERQVDLKAATWPFPTYEYTRHFSAFQSLEHFSWNFRVARHNDYTPASMVYFEEGKFPPLQKLGRAEDLLSDDHYIAYPFAVHCPTLKSFGLKAPPWLHEDTCLIKRNDNHRVELDRITFSESFEPLTQWNPTEEGHWPYVYPERDLNANDISSY